MPYRAQNRHHRAAGPIEGFKCTATSLCRSAHTNDLILDAGKALLNLLAAEQFGDDADSTGQDVTSASGWSVIGQPTDWQSFRSSPTEMRLSRR